MQTAFERATKKGHMGFKKTREDETITIFNCLKCPSSVIFNKHTENATGSALTHVCRSYNGNTDIALAGLPDREKVKGLKLSFVKDDVKPPRVERGYDTRVTASHDEIDGARI